jgi:hypothetical protein
MSTKALPREQDLSEKEDVQNKDSKTWFSLHIICAANRIDINNGSIQVRKRKDKPEALGIDFVASLR